MKSLVWLGDSRLVMRDFPAQVRQRAGRQLRRVQEGIEPEDWKPMASVGLGVKEIRIRAAGAYRVIYIAKFVEAVYVIHAFQKKTPKTSSGDIELARSRFRQLVNERKQA